MLSLPVIAFNASATIAEWYGDIQKGKRSKIINNRLERALRLESQPLEQYGRQETEDALKSHREQIEKLQQQITKFSMLADEKELILENYRSRSFLSRLFSGYW